MPLVLADRVRDTTTTTGTGTVTLSGTAPTGYQSFAVIGNGNTTYYTINAGSQWEVGIGTYSSTGPTLARNTVLESSNSNALVDFAAGTKDVFVTYPADEAVYQDGATIAAGTAVLGVANGGTGVTTSTGTSSVVLSNSPTLVTPTLGAASATSIANGLGAVGTPSYTFTGDLNTGIYSPAADTLAFVEGGVEAMRINSSADVGIGTSSPAGRLTVASATGNTGFNTGTSSSPERGNLWYDTDGTGWKFNIGKLQSGTFTAQMTFQDNGNVGIGTSSVSAVFGTTVKVYSAGSGGTLEVGGATVNARFYGSEGLGLGGIGTSTNHPFTFISNDTERMRITSAGNVGIACTPLSVTRFQTSIGTDRRFSVFLNGSDNVFGFLTDAGNWTDTFLNGTPLRFGISGTERMRIDSSGNVGIGTTSPASRLDVVGGTDTLRVTNTDATAFSGVSFYDNVGTRAQIWAGGSSYASFGGAGSLNYSANSGPHVWYTNYAERMRITATGDVGIGTSSPDIFGRFYTRTVGINSSGTTMLQINGTTYGGIDLGFNGARTANILAETAGFYLQTVTASPMVFVTNSSERMRIDSSGRVGIGTSAPDTTFEVALSTSGSPGLRASRSGAPSQYIQMDIGGGASARLFATGANKAMFITNNNSGAGLGTATDSTFIQVPGPSANTPITAMYLQSSTANVGIGTTSPDAKLDVLGASSDQLRLRTAETEEYRIGRNSSTGLLDFYGSQTGFTGYTFGGIDGERMRIDSSGRVGIGTSAPNANLQIVSANTTVARLTTTGAATQAELSFGSVGGSALVSLDQSGNLVTRTQQGSVFFDNFGAGGSINFRTGGANTRFSISNTGAITSSDLADAVGYKGLPPNAQGSGYTLVMADQGKMVTITGGVTIPANGSVAFPVGTTVVIYNNSASNQTISITTDTLRLAGTATTGARTLAQRGFATCIKVAATEWVVTGNVT